MLVTGATGSGKTTTLAAIVGHINATRAAAHRHDRGPDRDPARRPALHRQPARGRPRHRVVRPGAPPRAAPGPRRDPDRRAARRRDGADRDAGGRVRATSSSRRCTRSTRPRRSAASSSSSRRRSSSRSGRSSPASSAASISQRLLPRVDGGRVAAVEVMVTNARIADLIRENRADEIDGRDRRRRLLQDADLHAGADRPRARRARSTARSPRTPRRTSTTSWSRSTTRSKAAGRATERRPRPRRPRPRRARPACASSHRAEQ